eukprot:232697_1
MALSKIDNIIQLVDNECSAEQKESTTMNRIASKSSVKLYTSWFCPFAQRVRMALELKQIPYEYVEVDPYNKTGEWLERNPRGLVPTLYHNNQYIYESSIVLEYLDDAFPDNPYKLFPKDAYQKALCRIWIDHINKKMIKPFYQILQYQTDRKQEREEAIKTYFNEISKLVENMDCTGPFFTGDTLGAVDLAFIPWATRTFLLEHYRDIQWADSFENKQTLERYERWYHAWKSLECVKATRKTDTITNEQYEPKLIKKYERYAKNTAKTLVADAVNKGTAMP